MQSVVQEATRPSRPDRRIVNADVLRKRLLPATDIHMYARNDQGRAELEHYIAGQFAENYNAVVDHFLPHLLQLKCQRGACAAVGIGSAQQGPLFLEQYLDRPIEQELSYLTRTPVDRQSIIEIGNLVATQRGSSQLLFTVLTNVLHTAGFRWVVFTATQNVARIIAKSHFTPFTLCSADPARLPNGGAQWGSYYDTQPHVMAGDLEVTAQQSREHPLLRLLLEHYDSEISQLAEQLKCDYQQ